MCKSLTAAPGVKTKKCKTNVPGVKCSEIQNFNCSTRRNGCYGGMQNFKCEKCKILTAAPGVMGDSDINQLKDAEFKEAFDEFDVVILD